MNAGTPMDQWRPALNSPPDKPWESRWFASKKYSDYILEDFNIRKYQVENGITGNLKSDFPIFSQRNLMFFKLQNIFQCIADAAFVIDD